MILWHNPRCSKSRAALGGPVIDMMRPCEPAFRALGLTRGSDEDALLRAMAAEPKLIERPILFVGGRAAIGRPPETLLALL